MIDTAAPREPDSSVMGINGRIRWSCALDYPGMSLESILRQILAVPSALAAELARGDRNYTIDMIIKLASELGTSIEWLIQGAVKRIRVSVPDLDDQEKVIQENYRQSSSEGQALIEFYLRCETILHSLPDKVRRSVIGSIKQLMSDGSLRAEFQETANIVCTRACARYAYEVGDFDQSEQIITPFHEASGIDPSGKRNLSEVLEVKTETASVTKKLGQAPRQKSVPAR